MGFLWPLGQEGGSKAQPKLKQKKAAPKVEGSKSRNDELRKRQSTDSNN
jgi:hypothetical protein